MKRRNEYTIKQALDEMIESYGMKAKLNSVKATEAWEKMVGKMIAKHTRNVYVKNRKLFIFLDSAPLKQELSYQKTRVVELLNEEVGEEVILEVIIK